MQEYISAATRLVAGLDAPPNAHAVWVHTATDPETEEFVYSVRAAIHPDWRNRVSLPDEIDGKPVVQVDWETLEPINKG